MLERKISDDLLEWKRSGTGKALLLTGARQIGKSYAVREFAKHEYAHYLEINLYENKQAARALASANDVQEFISRLTLFSPSTLIPGDTLIFIDEVQEAPDVMTMVKFLVADGRFDYVFSGSMLGTEFKGVRSYPVGSVIEKTMRPMDFEEFCWAIGVQKSTLENIRESCRSVTPIDRYIHDAMMTNFRTYLVVGGMPEVVQRFLDTKGDLAAVRAVQNELNRQYRHDISQYAGNRALQVQEIFDQLPTQLIDGNGRFAVSSISPGARYDRNTGMLMARYPQPTAQAAYLDDSSPNLGAIYENVIAQELTAQGIPLYYYMAKKHGEVDFIADTNADSVMPFEVKSGRSYRTHAAIDAVLANAEYRISQGVVLSRSNIAQDGGTTYLPLYATYCLRDVCNLASPSTISTIGDFSLTVHPV